MSHLVLDSGRQAVHRRVGTLLRNIDRLRATAAEATRRDSLAKEGDGDFTTNSLDSVMGKSLHHLELMRRLRLCNRNLYFELSPATKRFGLYLPDATAIGTPLAPHVRYLGMSIAQGMNPEFTPKLTNDKGDLVSVQSGYRTVLARLLRQGFASEADINRHFGLPSRTSLRWKTATT